MSRALFFFVSRRVIPLVLLRGGVSSPYFSRFLLLLFVALVLLRRCGILFVRFRFFTSRKSPRKEFTSGQRYQT